MDRTGMFYVYLSLAAAETVALMWLSLLPSVYSVPSGGPLRPGDIEHFAAYAAYGFLWRRVILNMAGAREGGKRTALYGIALPAAIGSLVGGASEAVQMLVPFRTADPLDLLADAAGSLFGSAVAPMIWNAFKRRI